jgi:hypothetical protein
MSLLLAVVTLVAASYLSFACFCIIHRMSDRTKWSLATAIIMIAGLGAYGWLQSLAYILGAVPVLKPALVAATLTAAAVLRLCPRIQVNS